jgi:cytochrome c oxidase cbb3-type subunit 4
VISGIFTTAAFICFLGITWWASTRHNRARFEEAAALPLTEDEQHLPQKRAEPCCRENAP